LALATAVLLPTAAQAYDDVSSQGTLTGPTALVATPTANWPRPHTALHVQVNLATGQIQIVPGAVKLITVPKVAGDGLGTLSLTVDAGSAVTDRSGGVPVTVTLTQQDLEALADGLPMAGSVTSGPNTGAVFDGVLAASPTVTSAPDPAVTTDAGTALSGAWTGLAGTATALGAQSLGQAVEDTFTTLAGSGTALAVPYAYSFSYSYGTSFHSDTAVTITPAQIAADAGLNPATLTGAIDQAKAKDAIAGLLASPTPETTLATWADTYWPSLKANLITALTVPYTASNGDAGDLVPDGTALSQRIGLLLKDKLAAAWGDLVTDNLGGTLAGSLQLQGGTLTHLVPLDATEVDLDDSYWNNLKDHAFVLGVGHDYQIPLPTAKRNPATPIYRFQSDDPAIASVDGNGLIHGYGVGTTRVVVEVTYNCVVDGSFEVTREVVYTVTVTEDLGVFSSQSASQKASLPPQVLRPSGEVDAPSASASAGALLEVTGPVRSGLLGALAAAMVVSGALLRRTATRRAEL
jgi:hypothetical protein